METVALSGAILYTACVYVLRSQGLFRGPQEKKKEKKKVNVTFPLGLQLSYRSTAEEGESTVQASVKVERVRLFPFVSFYHFIFFLPFAAPLVLGPLQEGGAKK